METPQRGKLDATPKSWRSFGVASGRPSLPAMTNRDRRPAPSDQDARVGLYALLLLALGLVYGLPLAILLWRAAL